MLVYDTTSWQATPDAPNLRVYLVYDFNEILLSLNVLVLFSGGKGILPGNSDIHFEDYPGIVPVAAYFPLSQGLQTL